MCNSLHLPLSLKGYVIPFIQKQVTISNPAAVDDGITWNWPVPDFKNDAERFLSKFEGDSAIDVESKGFEVLPDENLAGRALNW